MRYFALPIGLSLLTVLHYALVFGEAWMSEYVRPDETVALEITPPPPMPVSLEDIPAAPERARVREQEVNRSSQVSTTIPEEAPLNDRTRSNPAEDATRISQNAQEPSGRRVYQSFGGQVVMSSAPQPSPASQPGTAVARTTRIPSADELDAMEFLLEVEEGSIDELVRNLNGAFVREDRYWDASGSPVGSLSRFTYGGRMIQFVPLNGDTRVALPSASLHAVFEQVAASRVHRPRRITAYFRASGELREVKVDV